MTDNWLDGATGVLAFATFVLAGVTVWMSNRASNDSALARREADLQHRQSLSGGLTCDDLLLAAYPERGQSVVVEGTFRNIGNGPVVNAVMSLKVSTDAEPSASWSLGSYSSRQEKVFPARVTERNVAEPLSKQDWENATVRLEYRSIFWRPQFTEFVPSHMERLHGGGFRVSFRLEYMSGFERVEHD